MSSILDIDLDYFNLVEKPEQHFYDLLNWGNCSVAFIVEKHHHAYSRWKKLIERKKITEPSHILHIDEHHDMMNQITRPNIGNFLYHAMRIWESCQVHWMVTHPIDSPEMWLDDDVWELLSQRFSFGSNIPIGWPKPDLVSICTSPEFISNGLLKRLLRVLNEFMTKKYNKKVKFKV